MRRYNDHNKFPDHTNTIRYLVMTERPIDQLRREYSSRTLDLADLDRDPLRQFSQWFQEASEAGEYEPNAMSLATASADGIPSLRMVLLKGVEDSSFYFYTNYLSRKGKELAENPHASLLFWWQTLERQVRIEGIVTKAEETRSDHYFASRPEGSRLGAVSSPQSAEVPDRIWLENALNEAAVSYETTGYIDRPAHWGGYVLIPHRIEFWQGRPNRLHDRMVYLQEGGAWRIARLAP